MNGVKDIRGKQIAQQFLSLNQEGTIAGQTLCAKLMVSFFIANLAAISGFLSGMLAELISIGIIIPYRNSLIVYPCMGVAVVTFGWLALYYGFVKSFIGAAIATAITAVLSSVLSSQIQTIYILEVIIFTSIALFIAFISLISICLCLCLNKISFFSTKARLNYTCIVISLTVSMLASCLIYLFGEINSGHFVDLRNQGLLPNYAMPSAILSSLVLSIGAIAFGYGANSLINKHSKLFSFLQTWAITIGSWRGTSFHNLDLSRVNFKNAKLPNTDLRARKLYRTCFQGVTGLERARVDSRYLALEIPKVQKLLTRGCSEERNFSQLNLRGAYLQGADLRHMNFTDTDLTGADLRGADLRGCIFVRTQVIDVDFTDANLTGICIEDWSVNSQTVFNNVQCDYIYRKVDEKAEPTDRSPATRNFEPREFESLYQEVGNVVELVFKEGLNWRAFAFTLQQLQLDGDENLGLELKGIEKRGDLWVVKVTHNENVPRQVVEQQIYASYEELEHRLAEKEQQINQLLGIVSDQASAIKELSRKFGNSFFIVGSNITNLTGSGKIKYSEAAQQVRNIVSGSVDTTQVLSLSQNFLNQLQQQNVAIAPNLQAELIEQILLAEAEKDPAFKDILLNRGQQAINTMSESAIASAIREAIARLLPQP